MAGKEIAVKKYVVRLSAEERERLKALVRAGKSPVQLVTRARILLKTDVSEAGEGWSDSAIAAALDTSINNVARTRQQLVEEGFEATLKRKYNPNSARPRIFDGAAEAFPAPEARRLANRFEWHYTPKHGNWLDMAESELAVLTSQCLSRRIPDKPTLEKEVAALLVPVSADNARNDRHRTIHLRTCV